MTGQDGLESVTPRSILSAGTAVTGVAALSVSVEHLADSWWSWVSAPGLGIGLGASFGALFVLAVVGAAVRGLLAKVTRRSFLRARWVAMSVPWLVTFVVRPSVRRRYRTTEHFDRLDDFYGADPRRRESDESDFGVGWREGDYIGIRLTYVHDTCEVVAVRESGPPGARVRIIGSATNDRLLQARIADWEYARLGGASLRWVRLRLAGLDIPIPPGGERWRREDAFQPPSRNFSPSTASAVGAYHGRRSEGETVVEVVDTRGTRPLVSPGFGREDFEWGYSGTGPYDLARAILADRLGWPPMLPIVAKFASSVTSTLERAGFVLTFKQVDAWIESHGKLFAQCPYAEHLELWDR